MKKETKKILIVALLVVSFFGTIPLVSQAAGLNVCGTTDQTKITNYQNWLIANPKEKFSSPDAYYTALSKVEKDNNICQTKDIYRGFAKIINTLINYIGIFVVFRIVFVGFFMILAGNNEESLKSKKGQLLNAFIGLAIVLVSYVLINWVFSVFGIDGAFTLPFNPS